MAWVHGKRSLVRAGALVGLTTGLVAACATGGTRVDINDDGNITETVTSASSGGAGGQTSAGGTGGMPTTGTSMDGGGGAGGMPEPCEEDPCKLMPPQCGCSMGDKCTFVGTDIGCASEGTGVHGDTCANDGDCAAGTLCLILGERSACRDFCDTDADCDAPGGQCVLELNPNPSTKNWCTDNCDPVSTVGCTGGRCELGQDEVTMDWYTVCVGAGAGTQGAACSAIDDCAPGYGCLEVNNVDSCHRFCEVASPNCPASAPTCASFGAPAIIGNKEYGGCLCPFADGGCRRGGGDHRARAGEHRAV